MKIYQFRSKQNIPISINTAWEFFSNPNNLPKITPPGLNFEITSQLGDKMYAGMIIIYLVRPLFNIPTTWVTEITHVKEPFYFVDEQRFGPYKLWHHQHIFREVNGKVEMEDIISYAVPLGFVGRIINAIIVSKKVRSIFEYRTDVLNELFNK